jgi:predicted DNA-binding transcriptional regulator AlpA
VRASLEDRNHCAGTSAMPDKNEISEAEFVAACRTVITVFAGGWWKTNGMAAGPIKHPTNTQTAAMDCQTAAKYCGFGRTRFRQLVAGGVFPQPVTIEGRKRWLAAELEVSLVRLRRERLPRK